MLRKPQCGHKCRVPASYCSTESDSYSPTVKVLSKFLPQDLQTRDILVIFLQSREFSCSIFFSWERGKNRSSAAKKSSVYQNSPLFSVTKGRRFIVLYKENVENWYNIGLSEGANGLTRARPISSDSCSMISIWKLIHFDYAIFLKAFAEETLDPRWILSSSRGSKITSIR